MYRRLLYSRPYHICGFIPFFDRKEVEDFPELYKPPSPPVTGLERILALFQFDAQGYPSKEYTSVVQLTSGSFLIALVAGGCFRGSQAYDNYITLHQASKFVSVYEARRKLTDHVTLEFFRYGIKYGAKCAVFTFLLSMSIITVAAFRGKDGILEYTIAGFVAGGFVRMYLGWKATLGAGVLGSLMSTVVGCFIYLCGKFTNTSISDFRQWQYELRVGRDERMRQLRSLLYSDFEGSKTFNNYIKHLKKQFAYTLDKEDTVFVATPDPVIEEENDNVSATTQPESVQPESVKEANVS